VVKTLNARLARVEQSTAEMKQKMLRMLQEQRTAN
jgi:hypothetical protein